MSFEFRWRRINPSDDLGVCNQEGDWMVLQVRYPENINETIVRNGVCHGYRRITEMGEWQDIKLEVR